MKAVGAGKTRRNGILALRIVGQAAGEVMYYVLGAAFFCIGRITGKILNRYRHMNLPYSLVTHPCNPTLILLTGKGQG